MAGLHDLASEPLAQAAEPADSSLDVLSDVLEAVRRTGALFFVDVDGLKNINGEYGHDGGDQALITVAEALRVAARNTDIVARFGGALSGGLAWMASVLTALVLFVADHVPDAS